MVVHVPLHAHWRVVYGWLCVESVFQQHCLTNVKCANCSGARLLFVQATAICSTPLFIRHLMMHLSRWNSFICLHAHGWTNGIVIFLEENCNPSASGEMCKVVSCLTTDENS